MEQGARMLFEELQADFERSIQASIRLPYKFEQALDDLAQGDSQQEQIIESQHRAEIVREQLIYAIFAGALIIAGSILATIDVRYGLAGFALAVFVMALLLRIQLSG